MFDFIGSWPIETLAVKPAGHADELYQGEVINFNGELACR